MILSSTLNSVLLFMAPLECNDQCLSLFDLEQILEAITTRTCGESFNLEILKILGGSFLKFFITERLFLIHNKMNESMMSMLRGSLISNATLEKLGRERGIMVSMNCEDIAFIF